MKVKKFLSKSYVRQVLVFLSVFVIAQLFIIIGMFYSFQHSVNRQRDELSNNMIETLDETITQSVEQAETDLQSLMAMNIDSRILSGDSENARFIVANNLAKTLNTFIATTKATDIYAIYNAINDIFLLSRSDRVSYAELGPLRNFSEELGKSSTPPESDWHIVSLEEQQYLLHFYYYYDCYFIAAFHIDTFLTITSYDKLLDSNGCVVLTGPNISNYAAVGNRSFLDSLTNQDDSQNEYYINTRALSCGDLSASYISRKNIGINADMLSIVILAICLSSLVLLLVFLRYLQREILIPIDELSRTADIVKQGDLIRRAQLNCNSPELQELAASINSMISTIIHQRIISYENEIKQKNLELKYLQMQLRPHHFLNALSTISSMTYLGDNEKIRKFVELYSRDARYLFSVSVKAVPLTEEIQHVRDYIECQNILYPECVFSFIEVQPDAEMWLVPQMMLHALVENIYKHAVSLDTFTSFFIRATLQNEDNKKMLEIIVEDDGAGFPEDVIDRVNNSDSEIAKSSHVGLMNISHTLYLMYGQAHLMQLSNKKNHGGMIRIFIPHDQGKMAGGSVQREKGDYDADTNR